VRRVRGTGRASPPLAEDGRAPYSESVELLDAGTPSPLRAQGDPGRPVPETDTVVASPVEMLAQPGEPGAGTVGPDDLGGTARPSHRPAFRLAVLGLVLGVGFACGAALTSAHDADRARSAAAATARSAVDLVPLEVNALADDDGSVYVLASLRNAGSQPLVVQGARLGQVALTSSQKEVAPGAVWAGNGVLVGPCPSEADFHGPLALQVRTADGVRRSVSLQAFHDFVLHADQLPDPSSCRVEGFESSYLETFLVSSTPVGPRTTRMMLTLTPHLPQNVQVAVLSSMGVAEAGIVVKPVTGLPSIVVSDKSLLVTVDISAPRCSAVHLPAADGSPYVWFRGRTLPNGRVATGYAGDSSSVLVGVLRLLARACPAVMAG